MARMPLCETCGFEDHAEAAKVTNDNDSDDDDDDVLQYTVSH